jgi:release factor glutamine methyltransferase
MTIEVGQWRKVSYSRLADYSSDADIEILAILKNLLNKNTAWILANPDHIISPNEVEILDNRLERLIQGEPLAYIIKQIEFFTQTFYIENSVLIPRPETELLVEKALDWCGIQSKSVRLIDIGTGSGCIGLSILKYFPNMKGFGVDVSLSALRIAKKNKELLNINSFFLIKSDLLTAIKGKFDLVCANLPYIPSISLRDLKVSKFEPSIALDGGISGLEIIYKLLDQLNGRVNESGLILFEIQFDQAEQVSQYAKDVFPNSEISIIKDYSGHDRIISIEI